MDDTSDSTSAPPAAEAPEAAALPLEVSPAAGRLVAAGEEGEVVASKRGRGRTVWREWIKPFLMVAITVGSIRSAIADWNDVPTGSMRPSILEGDRIVVNKLAYDLKIPFTRVHLLEWGGPARGEIVVFFSPEDGKRLVKRVVAIAGDEIEVRANRLLINGEPARYQALDTSDGALPAYRPAPWDRVALEALGQAGHPVLFGDPSGRNRWFGPVVVPPDHYFVMGDNRDNSRDSRVFGFVPRGRIVGQATAVAASIDPERFFLPRWKRFFRELP